MKIFVLNCGSSSVKYKLYEMETETVLADGKVERIGQENAQITHQSMNHGEIEKTMPIYEHTVAISESLNLLVHPEVGVIDSLDEITGVGHRVLHGGEYFKESVLVSDKELALMDELRELGPLHMPANITGIRACQKIMPGTPQVAVFDTAFHSTMPKRAYLYAIPYDLYERYRVRKYGFHGTSHKYIAGRVGQLMGKDPAELKVISCHLGNGASIAAIDGGISVDTSMGFTPLEGLMMGTRSGDIDPAALDFIMEKENVPMSNINSMLNKHSGLYGIAGVSDMRDIEKGVLEGDKMCQIAFDMYEYRIRKYIGGYVAAMGGVDAIVFTAGIGENTPSLRSKLCESLSYLGITLDEERNQTRGQDIEISTPDSKVKVFIIPTDEEVVIARDTAAIIG
ncbi:MAG: acetate kinase [Firmicutes bacterium]|nr:acetate kinase [Bacillota bacterium]